MKRFLTIFFLLSVTVVYAQPQMLRGFVYEKSNGSPIPYANILVEGEARGTITNLDGYFQIADLPIGEVQVTVSFLGYETVSETVRIYKNKPNTVKVYLDEGSQMLNTVDLNIERAEKKVKVNTAVVNLNPKAIETFSAGGDPDLMKAISVLPGVVTTGDQGGQYTFEVARPSKTWSCSTG